MLNLIENIINKKTKKAIGLMSGTSLDGIDACIIEIENYDKDTKYKLIEFLTLEYSLEEKNRIEKLCNNKTSTVEEICFMNTYLGNKFAEACIAVCNSANISIDEIDFISSHGQTIYHMPNENSTMQIGELSVIAARTNCLTVGDFRPSDMAYGGQGAPLVPFVDYILYSHNEKGRILLNLGGIANITVLPANSTSKDIFAFDTGPANLLINAITEKITNGEKTFDEGGKMALKGKVDEELLEEIILKDTYLDIKPPKSTGREYYTEDFANSIYEKGIKRGLSNYDILATITAYTAKTIQNQINRFVLPKNDIHELYISGGGSHNQMIVKLLKECLDLEIYLTDDLGLPSDAKEAVAFAILGNQFLLGKSNNIPSATGANRDVIMGKLTIPS